MDFLPACVLFRSQITGVYHAVRGCTLALGTEHDPVKHPPPQLLQGEASLPWLEGRRERRGGSEEEGRAEGEKRGEGGRERRGGKEGEKRREASICTDCSISSTCCYVALCLPPYISRGSF